MLSPTRVIDAVRLLLETKQRGSRSGPFASRRIPASLACFCFAEALTDTFRSSARSSFLAWCCRPGKQSFDLTQLLAKGVFGRHESFLTSL